LLALLGSEAFADVHFLVKAKDGKEERVPGHRLLLSCNNIVFQALLYSVDFNKDGTFAYNPTKNDEKDIVIEGVNPESFKKVRSALLSLCCIILPLFLFSSGADHFFRFFW
jgi:hypothetical protein